MWMLPREHGGVCGDAAVVARFDLAGELRRWSGVPSAGDLVS
jgi:hypothetical protein